MENQIKQRSRCKELKELSEFTKDKKRKYGVGLHCKLCKKVIWKEKSEKRTPEQTDKLRKRQKKYRELNAEKNREYYQKNKQKLLEYAEAWRDKNKDRVRQYEEIFGKPRKREHYRLNKDILKEKCKKWVKQNPEKVKEARKKRFEKPENKLKHRIKQARRRALRSKATLKGFDKDISEIYKNCPEGFEVDHIVPLKGKNITGLHVPWNLRYLLPQENASKNNKLLNNCMEIKSAYEELNEKQ